MTVTIDKPVKNFRGSEFASKLDKDFIKNTKPIIMSTFDDGFLYFIIPANSVEDENFKLNTIDILNLGIKVISTNHKILMSNIEIPLLR